MKNIMIDKTSCERDFSPLFSGEQYCAPSHTFGPYVRDYYIIHFCLSGKGVLKDKYGEHNIKAGELFIIREGESTVYSADKEEPWHYVWIATLGKLSDGFEECPTVIECDTDFFERIKRTLDKNESRPEIYISYLCEVLYRGGAKSSNERPDPLSQIKSYIKYNYMLDITVEGIAALFGFERSYLYRIFKRRYGMGIKEYIIKVRMKKARELLESGSSVTKTAALVGYSDEFAFSKAFKKHFSLSPISCKKQASAKNTELII